MFFRYNNKVTRTTSLVLFCCPHLYSRSCFTNCLLTRRPHCICLEQNYIGKRSEGFEANDSHSYILNNTHFLWNQSRKQKKFLMSGKGGIHIHTHQFRLRKLIFYGSRGLGIGGEGADMREKGQGPDNPNTLLNRHWRK